MGPVDSYGPGVGHQLHPHLLGLELFFEQLETFQCCMKHYTSSLGHARRLKFNSYVDLLSVKCMRSFNCGDIGFTFQH